MGCIAGKPSAEFVDHLEDVLKVYHRPYDPKRPVVCGDETFKQLIGETREPLPMRPGTMARSDDVYTRTGVASLFLACEPLAGWRPIAVTDHRCRSDWALFIRALLAGRDREAEKLVLVLDQLNTHSPASLYEAFPPEEAKRRADRLAIHHTPKHGSWLNQAEIELSVRARQCLSRRIAHQDPLQRQIAGWEERRKAARPQIKWQFTTQADRVKTLVPGGRDQFAQHRCPNGGSPDSPDVWSVAQGMAGEAQIRHAKAPAASWAVKNVGSRRPSDRHCRQQILEPDQIEHSP
jgi:hypothetical protein